MEQSDFGRFEISFLSNVPRETLDRLIQYYDLLLKWQKSINLVSPKTIDVAWKRHFCDSAQLLPLIPDLKKPIFDLGSGGGFPGMVLSIMGASDMHLIESDQRKGVFLSEVVRATRSNAKIHTARIEQFTPSTKASLITSRALAPIGDLLDHSIRLLEEDGRCIFLKGKAVSDELTDAAQKYSFHVEQHPSQTDADGVIVTLSHIQKKG